MAIQMGKTLALTAVGGMVAGLVGCGSSAPAPTDPSAAPAADPASATAVPEAKDCCKGKNECKGKGNCKVEGGNDCKGKNECKGKGGCKAADCAGADPMAAPPAP
jgi:hypothetical protein